ncbi:26273_t:CDS:2, partial [Racocetra persica]
MEQSGSSCDGDFNIDSEFFDEINRLLDELDSESSSEFVYSSSGSSSHNQSGSYSPPERPRRPSRRGSRRVSGSSCAGDFNIDSELFDFDKSSYAELLDNINELFASENLEEHDNM